LDDIEVARYALRTFEVDYDAEVLRSAVKPGWHWHNGTCVAKCLRRHKHKAPHQRCSCGIYGTLTLEHLMRQFSGYATQLVAVIAAEGTTIIGDVGLRTAAARVVAYWTSSFDIHQICEKWCAAAKGFEDLDEMLAAYNFPIPQVIFHCTTLAGPLAATTAGGLARKYAHVVNRDGATYARLHCNGRQISGWVKIPLLLVFGGTLQWEATVFDVPESSGELLLTLSPTPDGPPADEVSLGWWQNTIPTQVVVTVTYVAGYRMVQP
jgi:hypothetical protein